MAAVFPVLRMREFGQEMNNIHAKYLTECVNFARIGV